MPESMHMIMWVMSDRAIPRSFRMMEGFGVHTFRFINERQVAVCKIPLETVLVCIPSSGMKRKRSLGKTRTSIGAIYGSRSRMATSGMGARRTNRRGKG